MRGAVIALVLMFWGCSAAAQSLTDDLLDATNTDGLLAQLAIEAGRSAEDVNRDFLGGSGGAILFETVSQLNDPVRLRPKIAAAMTELLGADEMRAVLSFYASDLGQRITRLEMSARATIFEPSIEQAVRARIAEDGVPEMVTDIIVQGDLIERNVTDAIRVLRKFYGGRSAGGTTDLSPAEMDAFIEEQRGGVRQETQAWLEAYMTLAYSPLSEDDLQIYADFWKTNAGKAYDRALFEAYARVFEENSFALGQLVGRLEASDEI